MLMVDRVHDLMVDQAPSLTASRHISMNEWFFAGHFPAFPVWPGALTLEGLGQTAHLLLTITTLLRESEDEGRSREDVLEALRNLDRGFRLHAGYRAEAAGTLLARLRNHAGEIAMGASVEMKFLRPVFPGCRLDYSVTLVDQRGHARFEAVASVDEEEVARGTLTAARRPWSLPHGA
jgi:3-hydroxyacyl-[acyl-carrier-protein] dehydratase